MKKLLPTTEDRPLEDQLLVNLSQIIEDNSFDGEGLQAILGSLNSILSSLHSDNFERSQRESNVNQVTQFLSEGGKKVANNVSATIANVILILSRKGTLKQKQKEEIERTISEIELFKCMNAELMKFEPRDENAVATREKILNAINRIIEALGNKLKSLIEISQTIS